MKKSKRIPNIMINIMFCLGSLVFILPFVLIISASFSDEQTLLSEGYKLIPSVFSTDAYKYVFRNPQQLLDSYKVTIIYSIVATVLGVVVMAMLAYPLSRKGLKGSKIVNLFCVITMYLNLGTIPNYLNIKSFGMIDTVWALIIPGALSVYNMIIMRTAFASIDDSLYEAARIDGCGEFKIMYRIAIPLCVPTIATLCLFYAVGRWNGIDDQLYYVQKTGLHTVQMALKQMIEAVNVQSEESGTTQLVAENIKAASITLSMTPMLVVYPFIQRFFTQGIMLGAVKG